MFRCNLTVCPLSLLVYSSRPVLASIGAGVLAARRTRASHRLHRAVGPAEREQCRAEVHIVDLLAEDEAENIYVDNVQIDIGEPNVTAPFIKKRQEQKAAITCLRGCIAEMERHASALREDMESESQAAAQRLEAKEAERQELENERDKLMEAKATQEQESAAAIQALKSEMEVIREEMSALQCRRAEEAQHAASALDSKMSEMEDLRVNLSSAIDTKVSEIEGLNAQMADAREAAAIREVDLKSQLEATTLAKDGIIARLREQLAFRMRVGDERRKALMRNANFYREAHLRAQTRNGANEQQHAAQLAELHAKLEAAHTSAAALQAAVDSHEQQMQTSEKRHRMQMDELRAAHETDVAALVTSHREVLAEKDARLQALESEKDTQQSSLDAAIRDRDAAIDSAREKDAKLADAEASRASLEAELARLQAAMDETSGRAAVAEEELASMAQRETSELDRLQSCMDLRESELASATAECTQLKAKLVDAVEKVKAADALSADLMHKVETQEAELIVLKAAKESSVIMEMATVGSGGIGMPRTITKTRSKASSGVDPPLRTAAKKPTPTPRPRPTYYFATNDGTRRTNCVIVKDFYCFMCV